MSYNRTNNKTQIRKARLQVKVETCEAGSVLLILGFLALLFCALMSFQVRAQGENRNFVLKSAQQLVHQNHSRLAEIDASIERLLKEAASMAVVQSSEAKLTALEQELERLTSQRQEHLLRQEFFDRLYFQLDKSYQGKNLKSFLHQKALIMAQIEATSASPESPLWRFLTYLAIAIKELPERHEDPLGFLEGYLKFSSISKPKRPNEFLAKRNYTNGVHYESAQPVDRDQVGEKVETQIQQLQERYQRQKMNFETRKPILKPVSQMIEEIEGDLESKSAPLLDEKISKKTSKKISEKTSQKISGKISENSENPSNEEKPNSAFITDSPYTFEIRGESRLALPEMEQEEKGPQAAEPEDGMKVRLVPKSQR